MDPNALDIEMEIARMERQCGHEVECETCGERGCPFESCPNFDSHFRRELLKQLTQESQELGLYDEPDVDRLEDE